MFLRTFAPTKPISLNPLLSVPFGPPHNQTVCDTRQCAPAATRFAARELGGAPLVIGQCDRQLAPVI